MRRPNLNIGRSEALAVAAIVLATALFVVESRFNEKWGTGIHFAYLGIAALAILLVAITEPTSGDPTPTQSVLYVTGFLLAVRALSHLAEVLGADQGLNAWETLSWVGAVLAVLGGYLAYAKGSAVMALFAAISFGVAVESAYEWIFDPSNPDGLRWILIALFVIYAVGVHLSRVDRPRHAVAFADAAGLTMVVMAITFLGDPAGAILGIVVGQNDPATAAGTGWELVMLLAGGGLLAYAAFDRAPGPAYFGGYTLVSFSILASGRGGPDLLWWPLILLIAAGVAVAYALAPADSGGGSTSGVSPL